VTTQPDTDAPPIHAPGCRMPGCEGECADLLEHRDAPQEGRHPDVKRLASWLRGSYGHAFPRVDWEADAAEVLDLFASDYSAPQEGRPTTDADLLDGLMVEPDPTYWKGLPTTPQTEALICVCGKPLALSHISWDANYSPHPPEAAAGALPSVVVDLLRDVEREFVPTYGPSESGTRVDLATAFREWLALAAPPEASER
jgi:hypothetical protein